MTLPPLQLKKGEDQRLRKGHVWVYSNEVNSEKTPFKDFTPGEEVLLRAHNQDYIGVAYVNPHSLIAARLFSSNIKDRLNAELFYERLERALLFREKMYPLSNYRLVFGESDDLPGVVIDRYGEHLVVQCNTYGIEIRKNELLLAIQNILPNIKSVLWRNDSSIRQQEGLTAEVKLAFGEPPEEILIEENGALFSVPLWKGQKTGWFFDHHLNRRRLKDYVGGQRVLDIFSYLGSWGIQAACYGAEAVHCIESSAFACEYIIKNAALNQMQNTVHVICEEAIPALQQLYKEKKQFDVIVLDPPAFIKRSKDKKEGMLAYQRVNALAQRLLSQNGIFVSSSCSMHLTNEDFMHVLQQAALQARCHFQILERGHQGPDHPVHLAIPETDYLKAIFLRRLGR